MLLKKTDLLHFTDLGRIYYLADQHLEPARNVERPSSATKLDKAGVKIKAFLGRDLLDIQFHKNKCLESYAFLNCSRLLHCLPCLKCCLERMQPFLEIPPFTVDDRTKQIFQNLMAMEQCHYQWHSYICNYVSLLGLSYRQRRRCGFAC